MRVIGVQWLGSETPGCAVIRPLCALYTRSALRSNSSTLRLRSSASTCLQQFQPHQAAADAVERGLDEVGGDDGLLAAGRRSRRRAAACRRAPCWRMRRAPLALPPPERRSAAPRRCRTVPAAGRRAGRRARRRRREPRRLAGVLVPGVPQEDEGHREHHPQEGTADIGHEGGLLCGRRSERSGRHGVKPPSHQGWQRSTRRAAR